MITLITFFNDFLYPVCKLKILQKMDFMPFPIFFAFAKTGLTLFHRLLNYAPDYFRLQAKTRGEA